MSSEPASATSSPAINDLNDALSALATKAAAEGLNEQHQQIIGRLINLGNSLSHLTREPWREHLVSQFGQTATIAADPKTFNATVVQGLCDDLQVKYNWQKDWLVRLLWRVGQGKPTIAAVAGTLFAYVLMILFFAGFFCIWNSIGLEGRIYRMEVGILVFAAINGSIVSQYQSLFNPPATFYDPGLILTRSILKVVIAVVFSLAVLATLKTGVVTIEGLLPPAESPEKEYSGDLFSMFLIGFLSGFSEKFAPGIFNKVPS